MRFNLRFFFTITILLISALTLSAKVDSIHISINNPKCFAGTDGYVTIDSISTSAPTGPYLIRINTTPVQFPNIGDTISLRNGNFTITVFDIGDGNTPSFRSFSIVEPFQLVTATIYSPPSCYGNCDGYADIFAFDGTPPYTYQWSNTLAQTTTRATGLCVQKYYVTVTDANGCIAIDSVDISQPSQIQPNVTLVDVACFGDSTGSATISPTGGTGTYTSYAWSSSSNTTTTENNLAPGNYTVTVTDSDGCSNTENFTINEPTAPLSTTLSKIDVDCYGRNSGSINNIPSGGTSPYTYVWNDATTTRNRSNLTVGTYIVTITDSNNCTFTDSITINEPAQINNIFSTTDVLCNGDSSGSITASASNGMPNYTYQWSNGTNGAINNNLPAGKYYVTITDAASCTKIDSTTIGEPLALQATANSFSNPSCNGDSDGSIDIVVTGGVSPYSYIWNDAATIKNRTGLSAGTYILLVSDKNACTDTVSITLNNPAVLTATIDSTKNTSCNGSNDGYASVAANGGTAPYSYAWSNSVNTIQNGNLVKGTYNVTITDAKGCTASTIATITDPAVLIASATSTDVSCQGLSDGTATASGTGGTTPYTFLWSNTDTTASISNLLAGNYFVTITDDNGCSDIDTVTINQPTAIVLSIIADNLNCNNDSSGSATVTANGGAPPYSFSWNDPSNQTTAKASNLKAGKIMVTVTDKNGCSAIDSITITEPTPLIASISSATDPNCNGGNDGVATVSAVGGNPTYTYVWNDSSSQITASASNLSAGNYIVTVTDSHGCTDTAMVTLKNPAPTVISLDSIKHVNCFGENNGLINLSISGGSSPYTYTWNDAVTTKNRANLSAGSYTITVTDARGCTEKRNFIIKEPAGALNTTISIKDNIKCFGDSNGSLDLNVSGGTLPYTFLWNDAVTTKDRVNLKAGKYYVTVTDSSGCAQLDSITLNEPDSLKPNLTTTNTSCSGVSDGSATAVPTGGVSPYTYQWSVAGSSSSISNLSAGSYSLTVTDANGCDTVQTFTINNDIVTFTYNDSLKNNDCFGDCTGTIDIRNLSGGTAPYSYQWSANAGNVGNTPSISGLCAGTYFLTISDANGCDSITNFVISAPSRLNSTMRNSNESCIPGNDGSASVIASGGTAPYSYSWSNSQTNDSITGLTAGKYVVTITDKNGCTIKDSTTVTGNVSLTFVDSLEHNNCFGDCLGKIQIIGLSGGKAPYTYQWSNSAGNTNSIDSLCTGSYSLTITDANGCDSTMIFNILEPAILIANTSQIDESCIGNDGAVVTKPIGGTPPYTYHWSNNQSTDSIYGLTAGNYYVTITDSLGCIFIDTATVGVNNASPFTFKDSVEQNACFGDCLGKIEILNMAGGNAPYVFQWSNGAGNTTSIDSLCSGTYTLTITDANGCDSTMIFNITEPTQLTTNSTSTIESCARNDGTAATSVSGGTPPYTYNWSSSQNTDSINGLTAGSYYVTITDSLGCVLIDTVIINREPAIIPNEITNNVSCFGDCDGSVQFNPSGGNTSNYTYNWAPVPPAGQGVSSASNLCPGNYKVTISGSGVCDTIVNINIIEPALLTSNIITEDEKCGSPTANCNGKAYANTSGGTAPYTYSWPTGTTSGINQDTILQVCAGNYQLTITDANGCSITENFTINKSNPIVASFNAVNSSCNICDGALDVVASGGTAPYSYLWYDQALNPISGSDSILNNICSGIYYVDIIDSNGCIQRFNSNIIDNNSEAIAVSIKDASCNGTCDGEATVSFNCSDPLCSVEWYNATTAAPLGINSLMATNLCAGDYYVEVINGSGCKTSQRITVNEPTKFSISENIANVNCASACDGKIDLVVSGTSGGPFTYNWSPTPAVGQGTANISGLCAGSYSVTISNNALCDTVITYIVNAPTAITASFTTIQPNCGQSNGSISATVNGGTVAVNYNYQWFDGANNLLVGETSANINNIPAGAYRLRVKDDNNCLDFFTTILGNIDGPTIAVDSIQDASCFSNKNGSIELDVSGGTAPYTYNWLPTGQSTEDVFNLSAGHYTVLVTDAANCISTQSFEIKQFNALNASFSTKEASCGECNGEASIIMNGGISPYTYLWSNGSTVDSATNLCGGLHTVKVTDSVGCSKTFTVSINNIDAPIATIYSTPTSCANACDGTVKVSANGGTPPYTYNWMHNNSTADSLGGICAGEYAVQIIDAKGCSRLVDFKVVSPLEITVEAEIKASNCGSTPCNGSILLNAKGGQAPYSYDWGTTSSIDTNYINGLCAGLYTVKITDANGCTKTKIITLSNNGVPINSYPRTEDVGCYGRCDGSLISNLTPSTTVSFQWLDEKGNAVAPKDSDLIGAACAGDYYLQVFALANNCISYIPVSIDSPDSINLRPSIIKPISCTGACDAEVFVSTTGGELLYNYSWSDADNQQVIPAVGLCAGTYTVTATDANGCNATASITLIDPTPLSINLLTTKNVDCSSDCDGEATVSGTGGVPPYTFYWSGGQIGSSPTTLCFGPNVVTITDATNCEIRDTIYIGAADTVIAKIPTDTVFCEGEPIYLNGTPIGSSITSFGWYNADSTLFTNSKDTTISLGTGNYTFIFTVTNGSCSDTTAYHFKVIQSPSISMAKSMNLYEDDVKKIRVDGTKDHYAYQWSPDTNLSSTTIAEPYTNTRKTRFYTLLVLDTTGCTTLDSIEVIYSPRVEIPSGFSPNGDGVNDVWEIPVLIDFPNASVIVFNRWGELVYKADNGYTNPWDGIFKGKQLPVGTYYYVIDFKSDKFKQMTGPVTIIK